MKRLVISLSVLVLLVLTFLAGRSTAPGSGAGTPAAGGRKVLYYVDPMNPAFRSPEPGVAPCGMPLEPVYEDGGSAGALPAGAVQVRPDRQQLIGVRTAAVERRERTHVLRLLGRVAPDELRLFRLNSVTAGWVREISGPTTGSLVRKGELLGSYYSQEILGPQQAYIYAVNALERFQESGQATDVQIDVNERNVDATKQTLINLGMSEEQIAGITKSRAVAPMIEMRAPGSGVVLARNVALGQRFDQTSELFVIADLSRVWVLADAFERDADAFRPGARATIRLPGVERTYTGVVSRSLPQFDPQTRTLKVRLEVDNPGLLLRPDMFVDVDMPVTLPAAVVVPDSAVVDSGARKSVFVEREPGVFEPRAVSTGVRAGGEVEIVAGLQPGETIVVSGNFLLDSESRMRASGSMAADAPSGTGNGEAAVAPGEAGAARDPVCNMVVDAAQARAEGLTADHGGKTYYFCNPSCRDRFARDPETYLARSTARQAP